MTRALTKTEKRELTLRAADHIEQDSVRYNFFSTDVPESLDCGTDACVLGWIAFELFQLLGPKALGDVVESDIVTTAYKVFGCSDIGFYRQMDWHQQPGEHWMDNNIDAANILRRLVNEKFPV